MSKFVLQKRRTASFKVLTTKPEIEDQSVQNTSFMSQHPMSFGKNIGDLFRCTDGTVYFEWKLRISKKRHILLLELEHPDIIHIDKGKWLSSVVNDNLQMECIFQISIPIENQTTSIKRALIDLHRMNVDDIVDCEARMRTSDAYHMCKNILSALEFLCHKELVMGEFSANDIAYTATGYKIMNVDRSETPDQCIDIVDLRSVGVVMIKMLTRIEISHSKPLMLTKKKLAAPEDYEFLKKFLEIAEVIPKNTDLRSYREHIESYRKQLVLLKKQLAKWCWDKKPLEEKQLETEQLIRSRELISKVGQNQGNSI